MSDELEWRLAGTVALTLHLADKRAGVVTDDTRWHDHDLLTRYGYDMALCDCVGPKVSAYLIRETAPN